MGSIASKKEQRQERKAKRRERARRKAKVHKGQVLARRRQWDRAQRARERRERREHNRRTQREFKFRVKVVRHFHRLREQGVLEKRAVELSLDKYRPRQERPAFTYSATYIYEENLQCHLGSFIRLKLKHITSLSIGTGLTLS